MPTWICRQCGTFNERGALRCAECGVPGLDQPATEAVAAVSSAAPEPPPTTAVPATGPPPTTAVPATGPPPTTAVPPVGPPVAAAPPAAPPPVGPPPPVEPPADGPPPGGPGGIDKRWWIVAGVAALLLGVLVAALLLRDGGGDDHESAATTTSTSTTTAPPTTTSSSTTTTTTEPPTTTTTEPPLLEIDQADLRAGTYRILCPGGEVSVRPDQPDGANVVGAFEVQVVGDISGDGRPDAVVAVGCTGNGGNAVVDSVVAISSERSGPTQLGGPIPGRGPTVVEDAYVVAQDRFAEGDATCCPSTTAYAPFRAEGGVLVPGGGTPPTSDDDLGPAGLGSLEIGRTYEQVAAATGTTVVVGQAVDGSGDGACTYVSFEGGPSDLDGLGGDGTVRTVGTASGAYRTEGGLQVGDTEDDIVDVLPDDRLTVEDHPYDEGGHVVVYSPEDDPDRVVVFDTDGSSITGIRVGEPGWSAAAEGCS